MTNLDMQVNEILGIVDKNVATQITHPKPVTLIPRPNEVEDIDSDYKYSRENFYNLIERGQDAIDGILEIAKEGEHPRAYEVVGQLIKNVSEVEK